MGGTLFGAVAVLAAALLATVAAAEPGPSPAPVELETELDPPLWIVVELAPELAPRPWLTRNGIGARSEVFVQRLPDDGTLLSFPLERAQWEARRAELCGQEGVRSCEEDRCRAFLAPEGEPPSGQEPAAPAAAEPVAAETPAAEPATDAAPIRGLLRGSASRSAPRVALAHVRPHLTGLLAPTSETAPKDAPGQTQCPSDAKDFPSILLQSRIDPAVRFAFASPVASERFDPGCWEVVVTDLCSERTIPAREWLPEYEPGRLLALIAAAPPAQLQAAAQALAAAFGLTLLEVTPLPSLDAALVRLAAPNLDAANVAALLAARPEVQLAQRDFRYRTTGGYDDPRNFLNYGPPRMRADALHPRSRGSGVTVAVIDSGVDVEHPELDRRVESVDTTGFGRSADVHGTAIAGIIAARENNGIGAYGVAPGASVLSLKACQPEEPRRAESRCWSSTIAKALDRALRSSAQVLNLSLGGPEDPLVARLLERAVQQGKVVVAAAGNGGPDARPAYPAAYPDVVAVTAIDSADELYARATHGDFIDVAAPGVEVVVVDPALAYPVLSGTSMAAAHASGALALMLGLVPDAPAAQLGEALLSSAVDLGASGRDAEFGAGRIDVCAAVARLSGGSDPCTPAAATPPQAPAPDLAPGPTPEPPSDPADEPAPGAAAPEPPKGQ